MTGNTRGKLESYAVGRITRAIDLRPRKTRTAGLNRVSGAGCPIGIRYGHDTRSASVVVRFMRETRRKTAVGEEKINNIRSITTAGRRDRLSVVILGDAVVRERNGRERKKKKYATRGAITVTATTPARYIPRGYRGNNKRVPDDDDTLLYRRVSLVRGRVCRNDWRSRERAKKKKSSTSALTLPPNTACMYTGRSSIDIY